MADVTHAPRYASGDLIAAAAREELSASARLIRKWVQVGLIDRPTVHGRGRGLGVDATWSENQLRLFVAMLRGRRADRTIPELCRGPVYLWLRDDDYVPLRQMRRALNTWATSAGNPTWTAAQSGARAVTSSLTDPSRTKAELRRFRQTVEAQALGGFDLPGLAAAARGAIDPPRAISKPPGRAIASADNYTRLVAVRHLAIQRLPDTSDDAFVLARALYQSSKASYRALQPHLAADPTGGQLFEMLSDQQELDAACIDLLTALGSLHLLVASEQITDG